MKYTLSLKPLETQTTTTKEKTIQKEILLEAIKTLERRANFAFEQSHKKAESFKHDKKWLHEGNGLLSASNSLKDMYNKLV
jgi:hypothetical protein